MKATRLHIPTLLLLAALAGPTGGAAPDAPGAVRPGAMLQVYLPRSVSVAGENLRLGDIGVLRCADASLLARASGIAMGRAPWSGEKIVITRTTVLSRLACSGIRSGQVRMTGARQVSVTRRERVIPTRNIVQAAEDLLRKASGGKAQGGMRLPPGCRWRLIGGVRDLAVASGQAVELRAAFARDAPAGHVKVIVRAVPDDAPRADAPARKGPPPDLGRRELLFRLCYPHRQAVATKTLSAGDVISPQNTRIRTVYLERIPPRNWKVPYGKVVTRRLRAGTVLEPAVMTTPRSETVVKRNQTLVMKIEGDGFTVTALGLALQDGRAGEFIKVRNVDSGRIVTARVGPDGTAVPVFGKDNP